VTRLRRIICRIFGHDWNYAHGKPSSFCWRCGATFAAMTRFIELALGGFKK
jgi:hypothetical protein